MKGKDHSPSQRAFTRIELVMVAATLFLLAGIALPMLASNRYRSEQVSCFSNLRQIGRAFHLWANDHGDKNHWWTSIKDGGTYIALGETAPAAWPGGANIRNNAWFEMAWISNQLGTPKILFCPSDRGVGAVRIIASNFSGSPDGGLLNPAFKNRSVSYFLGLHAFYDAPRSILSGDRNLRFDPSNSGCASGLTLFQAINYPSQSSWTNAIHGATGHLLLTDGGVEQLSGEGLRRAQNADNSDIGLNQGHFIVPP